MDNTGQQERSNYQIARLISMTGKYGTRNVATFSSFDSKFFFAYTANKRKKAKVDVKIKLGNGTFKTGDIL
ncbi:MAG: hypothetical protein LBN01_04490 [Endomicrobium sp.]|jgi:hypothetical protein|nr:hypothetical protein [Endomicrobium sp.]